MKILLEVSCSTIRSPRYS